MRYSQAFKEKVVRRILPPNDESVISVSKDTGVAGNTIYIWLKKAKNGTLQKEGDITPNSRGANEKFRLLLEGKSISEDKQGEWLRTNGLHSEHLHQYEQEINELIMDKSEKQKQEIKKLKHENKELQKELRKKDKALAEVAALLTLKKKWNEYLEGKEDD